MSQQAAEIRSQVQQAYSQVAKANTHADSQCCNSEASCCAPDESAGLDKINQALGYSAAEAQAVPEGANLGLGCGNPQAIASLQAGESVLDLGSGAGFDCFLAAQAVGPEGQVIGVDMTASMLAKARENAQKIALQNVEFRLGEIEHLPVADSSVDVIISNCVINLSPEKDQVFAEALRVLKPGGRLAIADIVASAELPEAIKADMALYSGCMAGASLISELENLLQALGFIEIAIQPKDSSREFIRDWAPGRKVEEYVVSATIQAQKPF